MVISNITNEKGAVKMSIKKNKYSVCKVMKGDKIVGYLSSKDEENGLDIQLDMQGFTIIAL